MAEIFRRNILTFMSLLIFTTECFSNDILGCGGFVRSHVSLDFSKIEIGLYTKEGSLKEKTECAPTNGYYFLPLYEKGEYVLKVHPPGGWSFEPSQVEIFIDGETDQCTTGQDINFSFNGFGITGRVTTAGLSKGPSGVDVELVDELGVVRNTITTVGGDFHFTPVIPGKYILTASHLKWKLDPAQTNVQVKEGNTVLPAGVLVVKGYDVSGTVTSFGNPIFGIYVLLYSKEEKPKFRVEGCKTALLQGVPDSPICHSVTDAAGEFNFGLVPAGDYRLIAMSKSPGQNTITYNIKPDEVKFNLQHDSLYIISAFEVNGFNVIGSVLSTQGGAGMGRVRVLLGGEPVATTDASGQFALKNLKPDTYVLSFRHEQCEIDDLQLRVSSGGVVGGAGAATVMAARWRVCGALVPAVARAVLVLAGREQRARVTSQEDGSWCTYLPPGAYTAKVEVSELEQREGLQFFPEWRQITVSAAPLSGVSFSQVRARVEGRVRCAPHCGAMRVGLRALAADGTYLGPARLTDVVDERYVFEDVAPGSVELEAISARLCWAEDRHNVVVASERPAVPTFELSGLRVAVHISHPTTVEYRSASGETGVLALEAGGSSHCLPPSARYTLRPVGCHRFSPPEMTVEMKQRDDTVPEAKFRALAHEAVLKVVAPISVLDLVLLVSTDDKKTERLPLAPQQQGDEYVYEHVMYLEEGSVAEVYVSCDTLVVIPRGPQRVLGGVECQPRALELRGAAAQTIAGRLRPPVAGATVTLTGDDLKLVQVTREDGAYSFGPLDASRQYSVSVEKESYVFGEREASGEVAAHRLAEIDVRLRDHADDTPLEGALVSVSGGSFRRNVASAADGRLRFGALTPAQYYVKPNMKEYRFVPPHAIVAVADGRTHELEFRGTRVAWSALGRVTTLAGLGAAQVTVRVITAAAAAAACPPQDATTADDGHFRIRGLQPDCEYSIELKDGPAPRVTGLRLIKAPPPLKVNGTDITGLQLVVHQPQEVTDVTARVFASPSHARMLRITLSPVSPGPGVGVGASASASASASMGAGAGAPLVSLARLLADGTKYVVRLENSATRGALDVEDQVFYFISDGKYKHFEFEYAPEVKHGDQDMRASGSLLLPLVLVLVGLVWHRHRLPPLTPLLTSLVAALPMPPLPPLAPLPARDHQPTKKTVRKKQA